ncbi:uncharacterized protein [Physcomitrium patens]|uniref:uncharacterized protein isoform X1 n=1 Tax=Physcomitrium patens TaxID=3218 RepID=UPI003CCDB85D
MSSILCLGSHHSSRLGRDLACRQPKRTSQRGVANFQQRTERKREKGKRRAPRKLAKKKRPRRRRSTREGGRALREFVEKVQKQWMAAAMASDSESAEEAESEEDHAESSTASL